MLVLICTYFQYNSIVHARIFDTALSNNSMHNNTAMHVVATYVYHNEFPVPGASVVLRNR